MQVSTEFAAATEISRMKIRLAATVAMAMLLSGAPTSAQTSKDLFDELKAAGGVHPLAQLVCFPAVGQNQDKDFDLVAFSTDLASTLRAKGKTVPKEFLDAEKAPEKDRFLFLWAFSNGVAMHDKPETLSAVVGSNGTMWSEDGYPLGAKGPRNRFTVRMVFSRTGRYSRDVLVDGVIRASVHGRCEPVE